MYAEFALFQQKNSMLENYESTVLIKTRVVHGPNDRVTPFDLRNETYMVDVVESLPP